ncbi:MAG: hypothetical protein NTZ16_09855 [Verrucomicrobia bacterium]|nr:hypothetical protein [Verrucomicrobiota bacterium]
MKPKPLQRVPLLIAAGVIALVCLVQALRFDSLEQLEARTFDARVRLAARFPGQFSAAATNLGFVFISDDSIARLKDGSLADGPLKFRYGLYWPRHIYGRVLRELRRWVHPMDELGNPPKVFSFCPLWPSVEIDHGF